MENGLEEWNIMKRTALILTVCLLLLFSGCGGGSVPADEENRAEGEIILFAGGNGTEADPYRIETAEHLQELAAGVNSGENEGYAGVSFLVGEDIDLSGLDWTPIGSVADMEEHTAMFQGSFDGGGHTISNLTYKTGDDVIGVGLFGVSVGTIRNLTLENAAVEVTGANAMAIGGVIGYNMGPVEGLTIRHAKVTGNNCTGGVIGGNSVANVTDCTAEDVSVTVIGDNDFSSGRIIQVDIAECGGLIIGGGFGGTIANCTAQGTVTASGKEPVGLGGIGGCLEMMDSITNCTANVVIQTEQGGHAIGGLCGYAGTHSNSDVCQEELGFTVNNYPCVIENCTAAAEITAPDATHVGSLVGTGLYYYGEETAFAISNCAVSGSIDGAITPGTIAGRAEGSTITDCTANVVVDGASDGPQVGTTDKMYESADQYTEEETAERLLLDIEGTNEELFPVLCQDEYRQLWLDDCGAIVGEDAAEETADMLISYVTGTLVGEEAAAAYPDGDGAYFCGFLQDMRQITFDGSTISGTDDANKEVFRHEYNFVGLDEATGMYVYESNDADSGDFTYFCLAPDTPASTFHIEFRYGGSMEDLQKFDVGPYAFWMAAGIPINADQG